MALFGNPMHEPSNFTSASAHPVENHPLITVESSAFPPLRPSNGPAMAATGAAYPSSTPMTDHVPIFDINGSEEEDRDVQRKEINSEEMRRRKRAAEAKGKNIKTLGAPAASTSWADIVENEHGVENSGSDARKVGDGMDVENQPKVFFGHSMADVLRLGQPTEGPVLIDHARAQKRGEV